MKNNKTYVPNTVYKFNLYLKLDLEPKVSVYTDPHAFDDEYNVSKSYFTEDKIEELKQELINKIKETDNPFIIECTDIDGNYAVTDEQIFRI